MNKNLRIALYVVLLAGAVVFGLLFRNGFYRTTEEAANSSTNQSATTVGEPSKRAGSGEVGQMMTYGVLGLLSLLMLGILVARDVSHLVAHRVDKFIFDEDAEGERNPEYDDAEKVWPMGNTSKRSN